MPGSLCFCAVCRCLSVLDVYECVWLWFTSLPLCSWLELGCSFLSPRPAVWRQSQVSWGWEAARDRSCCSLVSPVPCLFYPAPCHTLSAPKHNQCPLLSLLSVLSQGSAFATKSFLWWCPRSCSGCVCQAAPDLWLMILSSGTSEVWFDVAGNVFPQDFLQTPAQEQTLMPESVREVGPKTKMRH